MNAIGHSYGSFQVKGDVTLRYCVHDKCDSYQKIESLNATYHGGNLLIGESANKADITVIAILDDGSRVELSTFDLENVVMTRDGDNEVTVKYLAAKTTVAVPAIYDNLPGTTSISEFEYTTKKGEITITKFVGSSKDIIIPAHVDRVPVRYIGDSAFENQDNIISVTVSDNVTNIGTMAFYSCRRMQAVTFGCGLYKIDGAAFYGCINLAEVNIPANVKTITNAVYVWRDGSNQLTGVFEGCKALTKVTIGDANTDIDMTTIGSEAFQGCTSLTTIRIGRAVKSIGVSAFQDCKKLTTVNYLGSKTEWKAVTQGSNWYKNTGVTTITYAN